MIFFLPPTPQHTPHLQVFDLQKVDLREALQLYAQLNNPITLLVCVCVCVCVFFKSSRGALCLDCLNMRVVVF